MPPLRILSHTQKLPGCIISRLILGATVVKVYKPLANTRDVRGGVFASGAGRGEDENLQGNPGRAKKARKSTDPKIDKSV